MDVQFITNDGKEVTANIILSENEYERYYEGMPIKIIYSSEYPNIARISYK